MASEHPHINTLQYLRQALRDELQALRELVVEQRLLVLMLVVVLAGSFYYLKPFPPRHLSMAAGSANDGYTMMARTIASYFRDHGVDLMIEESTGSVENAELLIDDRDEVEVAFIQGGALTPEQNVNIRLATTWAARGLWCASCFA